MKGYPNSVVTLEERVHLLSGIKKNTVVLNSDVRNHYSIFFYLNCFGGEWMKGYHNALHLLRELTTLFSCQSL